CGTSVLAGGDETSAKAVHRSVLPQCRHSSSSSRRRRNSARPQASKVARARRAADAWSSREKPWVNALSASFGRGTWTISGASSEKCGSKALLRTGKPSERYCALRLGKGKTVPALVAADA